MKILATLAILLGLAFPSFGATVYPAATNKANIFFDTNRFRMYSAFGLGNTNGIGDTGSALNGVGFTNGVISADLLNLDELDVGTMYLTNPPTFYGPVNDNTNASFPIVMGYLCNTNSGIVASPTVLRMLFNSLYWADIRSNMFVLSSNLVLYGNGGGLSNTLSKAYSAADIPLAARGAAAQSTNLFEVQDSGGNILFNVGSSGAVTNQTGQFTFGASGGGASLNFWNDADNQYINMVAGTGTNLDISGNVTMWDATANKITVPNLSGTNYLGGTNFIGGTSSANPVIVVSNNTVQFRNATANGTNIFYIDPATGALLWNTDGTYNIGAIGANRPKILNTSSDINCGANFTGQGKVVAGGVSWIAIGTRTALLAPDTTGGLRITDGSTFVKDRLYIAGAAKQLTDATPVELFTITGRTNSFVGGVIDYTIYCRDASLESQALSGIVTYAAVNTNGVWTTPVVTEVAANQSKCVTSGSITAAWTGAAASSGGTTNLTISVSGDTTLSPAASQFYIHWQLRNNGTNSVTAL